MKTYVLYMFVVRYHRFWPLWMMAGGFVVEKTRLVFHPHIDFVKSNTQPEQTEQQKTAYMWIEISGMLFFWVTEF